MAGATGLFAGFDVGTQGLKGLLIDADSRRVVARASRSYDLLPDLPPGAAEQHPDTWIEALSAVGRELFSASGIDSARLAGIGVSGQQHGLVVLGEDLRPLRAAKLWCDTSTAKEARELSSTLGRPIATGFTASKVSWLARHEPQTWRRVKHVLLPHDYVNLRLAGSAWSEAGDASGTGWFDPVRRAVDARACRAIDPRLEECLAPLAAAGSVPGCLSAEGAGLLGLPAARAGVPISTGAGDNMASAIGAGATRPGVCVLSLGTSATVFGFSASAVVDPTGAIAPFCDSTGGWLPLLCVMNATGAIEEVRAAFGASHAELEREAAALPALPDGPLFLPYFMGERVPDLPHARAALLDLRPGSLSRARVYRACLEGIALNLAHGVERMRALGMTCKELRAVGGGARNRLWLRIIADACRAVVVPQSELESGALGAALQALWSVARAAGSAESCDALVQPWLAADSEPLEPDAVGSQVLEAQGRRFLAAREALFGPLPS
ncbi:MAG TPA: xylulokinase [Planctomycetota bacterium]|nr:xylulokinase [Planctomycetota bacterium]